MLGFVADEDGGAKFVARRPEVCADACLIGEPCGWESLPTRPAAGQKPITEAQPGILEDLDALVHPETRGDPTSLLRWKSKSTYKLADELVRQGYKVSADSVGRLLKRLRCRLRPSKKRAP